MVTRTSDLVQRTRRHLYTGARDEQNKLQGGVSSGATTLTFKYELRGIVPGAYLGVDLEIFYVWSIDATGKTAIVDGGQLGSTPAAHADQAGVLVNPKFTDFDIFVALNEDLIDLSAPENGLYQVKTIDRNWDPINSGYDYAADAIGDPMEIRYKTYGVNNFQPIIHAFDVSYNMSTSDFPSGNAIWIYEGGNQGLPLHVRYPAGFTQLASITDDVQAVSGLPATANDIPPLGAAIRLVAPREVRRNFLEAQSDSRRSEEVPPGAVANSARGLQLLRQQRITSEAARLMERFAIYGGES